MPIDSIFTIGTFYELIERIVMPSLIMNINDSKTTIKLEAWPFCIDIISDIETQFANKQASQWLYHMYDNNFRIFVHLVEDAVPEENSQAGMDNYEQQPDVFPNVAIELAIDPLDFQLFFSGNEETIGDHPEAVFKKFNEELGQAQGEEDRVETLNRYKKEIQEVNYAKVRVSVERPNTRSLRGQATSQSS